MKLLMIYCNSFKYTPTIKTIEDAEENTSPAEFKDIQVAFIQVEQEDVERTAEVEKKLIKNLKWICSKNQLKHIILHSFAHLSESKADPLFTQELFNRLEGRLKNSGFTVNQTPFGYFLDLQIDAPGFSLARVFKHL